MFINPQADTPPTIDLEPSPGRPFRQRRGPADQSYNERVMAMSRRVETTVHHASLMIVEPTVNR